MAQHRLRVLVVDDNRDAADSLAILLTSWGHESRITYDGPAALALAERFRPDVVCLDLAMPLMNGFELAQQLRKRDGLAESVYFVLTGNSDEGTRSRCREAGLKFFLKPVDPEQMRRALEELDCGLSSALS